MDGWSMSREKASTVLIPVRNYYQNLIDQTPNGENAKTYEEYVEALNMAIFVLSNPWL